MTTSCCGPTLTAENLVLHYGKSPVVHNLTIGLKPGTVTALLGPNGSGKSTALRALARLHPLTHGTVRLTNGDHAQSIHTLSAKELARTLTLFAQSRVTPHGPIVRDVVAFGRHPHRKRFAGLTDNDQALIDRAMRLTGVEAFADRGIGELSGGEMQRVWFASCLAQDTGIVLLDEPTNHLDLRYQVEILDLVRDLADGHGIAVGIVLHDLDHAARIADHAVLMRDGHVHVAGPLKEVFTSENLTAVYSIPLTVVKNPDRGHLRVEIPERQHARTAVRA